MGFVQEEIQQVVSSWTPAEQQDLDSLLNHIFMLSETQKVVNRHEAQALDLKRQADGAAAKFASPAQGQQNRRLEKRQSSLRACKAESEQVEIDVSDAALSAYPKKEGNMNEEEEIFRLDFPTPDSFHSKQITLETPMHWLFY